MIEQPSTPDYLVIGHISKDLLSTDAAYTPGGTALYSAITAQRLGLQAAIVTAYAPEDDALLDIARTGGIWIHRVPSVQTTTFRNVYDDNGRRTQILSAHATSLSYEDVPVEWWGAPIIHLGPVARELPLLSLSANTHFLSRPECLLGITPQGWMRSWDASGNVSQSALPISTALLDLPSNAFLVLSSEDLGYRPRLRTRYAALAPLVAITQGAGEAHIYERGRTSRVAALRARSVDPTGAGDVFAAALFVSYKESRDLAASVRFAHAAAACNMEGYGPSAVPRREDVERRLGNDTDRPDV